MITIRELCPAATFPPERLARVEQALREDHETDLPWYLRLIIGIGAWIASLFFLGFAVMVIGFEQTHAGTYGMMGLVLLAASVAVGRLKLGFFVEQCALAVSLAAQVMIYFGFLGNDGTLRTAMLISICLAALLYIVFPSAISRWMTCLAALQITFFWIQAGDRGDPFSSLSRPMTYLPLMLFVFWAVHLAGICGTLIRPRAAAYFKPLGYAFVASLAIWQAQSLRYFFWMHPMAYGQQNIMAMVVFAHLRTLLIALTFFGVVVWAAGGVKVLRKHAPIFIGLALVLGLLTWVGLAGVVLALLFIVLGFSLQDRLILSLGLLFLPVFLSNYYYQLDLDLLAKSGVLIASGLSLLLLRTGLMRGLAINNQETA